MRSRCVATRRHPVGLGRSASVCIVVVAALSSACFEPQLHELETRGRPDAGRAPLADAGDQPPERDGGSEPLDAATSRGEEQRHPRCRAPLDEGTLRSGFVGVDDGKFKPNAWRESCDDVQPVTRCDSRSSCPFSAYCLTPEPGKQGYCVNQYPLGTYALLEYQDGACHHLVDEAYKRALCCADTEGVLCEPWPYAKPAAIGAFCADTSRCEAGLVCRQLGFASDIKPVGLCQCPETTSASTGVPTTCGYPSDPDEWAGPTAPSPEGSCSPARDVGFVDEVIAVSTDGEAPDDYENPPKLVATPSGAPAIAVPMEYEALLIAARADLPSPSPLTEMREVGFGYAIFDFGFHASALDAVFAEDGQLHVVSARPELTVRLFSSSGTTEWYEDDVDAKCEYTVELAFNEQGEREIVCDHWGLRYLLENESGWETHDFDVSELRWTALLPRPGKPPWIAYWGGSSTGILDIENDRDAVWEQGPAYLADAVQSGDTVYAVASRASETYETSVELVTISPDLVFASEVLWQQLDPRYVYADPTPRIAASSRGELAITYRTPDGLVLTERSTTGDFTSRLLTTHDGRAVPRFDANDSLEIYYYTSASWAGESYSLRRLRRGTCK